MNSLHAQIMNLPCNRFTVQVSEDRDLWYDDGHRDARHAAAELASKADAEKAELVEALRKIVEDAPVEEPEFYEGANHGNSYTNGAMRTHFFLAESVRAILAKHQP